MKTKTLLFILTGLLLLVLAPSLAQDSNDVCCVDQNLRTCTNLAPEDSDSCDTSIDGVTLHEDSTCAEVENDQGTQICQLGCCCKAQQPLGDDDSPVRQIACPIDQGYQFVNPDSANPSCTDVCLDTEPVTGGQTGEEDGGDAGTGPTREELLEGMCLRETANSFLLDQPDQVVIGSAVRLDWTLESECEQGEIEFFVQRSTSDEGPFEAVAQTTSNSHTDNGLVEETTYYYRIRAVFPDNSDLYSNIHSIRISNTQCEEEGQFCYNNGKATCEDGELSVDACGSSETCVMVGDVPECKPIGNVCDKCNRLYGMYSYVEGPSIEYEGQDYTCDPGLTETMPVCYVDASSTVVDPYKSCAEVNSCTDYATSDTCGENPCSLNTDCQWRATMGESQSQNLGFGVCTSQDPDVDSCSECESLDGGCTQSTCEILGSCYYNSEDESCTNTENVRCSDYETKTQCIGPEGSQQEVYVDVSYNTDRVRDEGNNQVTPSNDAAGLGKCYYALDQFGIDGCLKDADGYRDQSNLGDCPDDSQANPDCATDFENPETIMMVNEGGIIGRYTGITYSVQDNAYPSSEITTRHCLGGGCYPQTLTGDKIFIEQDYQGQVQLRYYSEDGAKNLEVVKSKTLNVDTIPPTVDITYEVEGGEGGSTIFLNVTTQDAYEVMCDWRFARNTQIDSGAFRNSVELEISGVSDGLYGFAVDCSDEARNTVTETAQIRVSTDGRIYDFQPNATTNVLEQALSARTTIPGTCKYSDNRTTYESMQSEFDSTGARLHTAEKTVEGTGIYEYNVACRLDSEDGTVTVQGNPSHVIKFAVDQDPPETNIAGLDADEIQNGVFTSGTVTLECDDTNEDLMDDNDVEWAYGCKELYLCEGQDCNPQPTGQTWARLTFESEGQKTYRYYSEDLGGNQGETTTFSFEVDQSPPEFSELGVKTTPKYYDEENQLTITRAENIIVEGRVSPDTNTIRIENLATGEAGNIPRCSAGQQHCITSSGMFTIPITLQGEDEVNELKITATDFVEQSTERTLDVKRDVTAPARPEFTMQTGEEDYLASYVSSYREQQEEQQTEQETFQTCQDVDCLIQASEACTPSSYTAESKQEYGNIGLNETITYSFLINDTDNESECKVKYGFDEVERTLIPEYNQSMQDQGNTTEEIDSYINQLREEGDQLEISGTCIYEKTNLTEMLINVTQETSVEEVPQPESCDGELDFEIFLGRMIG